MRSILGIIGAGTMGRGIAYLALIRGYEVVVYDRQEDSLDQAKAFILGRLRRDVERGKQSEIEAEQRLKYLTLTHTLDGLRMAQVIIEAVFEHLDVKQEVMQFVESVVSDQTMLLSNTSSLSISEIGTHLRHRERFLGMHFFNPAERMPLVEIIPGMDTTPEFVKKAEALAESLGKIKVIASDTPGFIVNRIARPYYNEALKIREHRVGEEQTIDRIMEAAGFPMGPFKLQDMIGLDINLTTTKQVFEQMFYDPRFRPSGLQSQMVKAGRLGRKSGRGFYIYEDRNMNLERSLPEKTGNTHKMGSMKKDVSQLNGDSDKLVGTYVLPVVWISGNGPLRSIIQSMLQRSAYTVKDLDTLQRLEPERVQEELRKSVAIFMTDHFDRKEKKERLRELEKAVPDDVLIFVSTHAALCVEMAAPLNHPERLIGYAYWPNFGAPPLIELGRHLLSTEERLEQAVTFMEKIGFRVEVVDDEIGFVFPRTLALIINEAALAFMEGVATAEDIDLAMKKGTNYPEGPLRWADWIGLDEVLLLLKALHQELGDDRYRPAPIMRKMVYAGWLGRKTGRGFYLYNPALIEK